MPKSKKTTLTVQGTAVTIFSANDDAYHKERHLHIEPVMLDVQRRIAFHSFAHILVSTPKIIEQRRDLWAFVEEQLVGKRIEAPSPDATQ